ncbi:hypothetical protein Angca_008520, partial [Angiostrongylus cantonensis]
MQVSLFLCMQIFHTSFSANILFLNTWNSKSHALTMKPFAERLTIKGHNVSIYSMTRKSMGSLGNGVHNLETIVPPEVQTEDQGSVGIVFWYMEMTPEALARTHLIGFEYLKHSMQDDMFQRVISTPYDLVILDEMFASAQGAMALAIQKKFNSKLALFATTDLISQASMGRGFCRNPVISPSFYTKTYNIMDCDVTRFIDRLITFKDVIEEQYAAIMVTSRWMQKAGEMLNVGSSYETIYEASFGTFTDFPSRFGFSSPQSRDLIDIAEHCQEPNELPSDLRQFVEDPNSKGTIYVAFGSVVTWTVAPPEVIEIFFDVFNSLTDYRIIFSYNGKAVDSVKPHVKILPWAPQRDILAHKNTILFFTHGGLKSVKEGICSNTAMLFLPFFADQPRNSLLARDMGFAEVIYKKNITKEELTIKINKVLTDGNLLAQLRKLSRQFLDHVVEPLEYGTQWAERIMKTSMVQSKYYKNRGRLLSW